MKQKMTLADLQNKLNEIIKQFKKNKININTIPLYGKNCWLVENVEFKIEQFDNGNYYIILNVKEE